ncbi:MAG: ethanolamine utilization protein EutH [Clostridium sp.]|nr:ethanolamine utilization protein EutH [Clostridium sp.]
MGNFLLYLVAFFFLIGSLDYAVGNKFGLGKTLKEGICNMGPLAISMVGVISLTPILAKMINLTFVPFVKKIGIEASILTSSFIAVDMGGYDMALELSSMYPITVFSGIVIASILGCTISFTMPLAMGMVKQSSKEELAKGMLCGIITVPIGLLLGGFLLNIGINTLLLNITPVLIISIILVLGIKYKPNVCLKLFSALGKLITLVSLIGLALQGISSISGVIILEEMTPLNDCLNIVGKIGLFLGGSCVMLEVIKLLLSKPLSYIEKHFNINSNTIAMLIASLASAIIVFSDFEDLNKDGKIICSAFSVSGAYVFGGQLGYVASVEPSIIDVYIVVKIISGLSAILLAYIIFIKRGDKEYER